MSKVTSSSLAAATTSAVINQTFQAGANVLQRKGLIIGTGDPAKEAGLTLDTPILITSPEDAGSKTGFGFMVHRLAEQFYQGSKGAIPVYISVQAEDGSAVQATGEIDFVGSSGVLAGTLSLYISGILNRPVNVTITDAMTADAIATATAAAINAIKELPVTATALTTVVTITAKSGGAWGNDISIVFNLLPGDVTPTGVTPVITDMASGNSSDDISTALDGLGTGDNANAIFITDMVHGYGQTTAILNSILDYVGAGNTKVGLYSEVVHRPFRSIVGDVATGSAGLAALIVVADARKSDRASGVIAVPGSATHPQEIAAQAMGIMARINNVRAQDMFVDIQLENISAGADTDDWTNDYTNRDTAVKTGISTTQVKSSVVNLQNMVTFYHPDTVPQGNNGYREMRNISILQNILNSQFVTFNAEKWKQTSIYEDKAQVSDPTARLKARDVEDVISEDVALINAWIGLGWIFETEFAINELKANPPTIRVGGDGFVNNIKVILAGMGNIIDNTTYFDVSIAVTLA